MKFIKGVMVGTTLSAGMMMMYAETGMSKKRMMKKGKQVAKKMGIM